ncbi:ATP-grasp fold amidoligase family protein [Fusobacterium ulcerans]|uniref:ATP-grasp fold amidoligase family protein n=3 Tax=Fusobacterium ulcerans TaxID=861 RepID=UPI001D0A9EFB|nr:ATP-grasp fold amidoligase family protein [Fusobacterium ulcerans]MCB8650998.1 glycosyltransferase [Fusobacterium ulcerans]
MKEKIKSIIGINGYFYYLKLKELYMKIFFYSNKQKEKYIKKQFKKKLGYEIDFNKEPETFNQKIQFRKLYDNNPLYSICADKYRVREYVKEKIGEEYLIPLYLVTDKLTEEQWDKLPNSFVAKANHNSGPVQIVKDKNKVDKKKIIKELNNQLKIDYGIISMEKFYSDIPRKIIVEKYLENIKEIPDDFKFHCFNGKNGFKCFIEHIVGRKINNLSDYESVYYDQKWEKMVFTIESKNYKFDFKKPKIFEKMLGIVKKISEDFEYIRVDLYNIEGKVYFGELTLCDGSGIAKFNPIEWDYKFGSYLEQKKLK